MSGDNSILRECLKLRKYCSIHDSSESELYPKAHFIWSAKAESYLYKHIPKLTNIKSGNNQIYNHMEDNYQLTNKKNLFLNLVSYYTSRVDPESDSIVNGYKPITNPVDCIPYSFYVRINAEVGEMFDIDVKLPKMFSRMLSLKETKFNSNMDDLLLFINHYKYIDSSIENMNRWIVKSINNKSLCAICENYEEIKEIINQSGEKRVLVQKYIQDVYLINQRKCKIRMFAINTSFNGIHQGYLFHKGYCRLAPRIYNQSITPFKNETFKQLTERHITHDSFNCIFDDSDEPIGCNVLTFEELAQQLHDTDQMFELFNTMKTIISDCMKATHQKIDPFKRKNCFEILSYDFLLIKNMHDNSCSAMLIDIEEDPINNCFKREEDELDDEYKYFIEQSEGKINIVLSELLEETLKITLDPIVYYLTGQMIEVNEYTQLSRLELIYDERNLNSISKINPIFKEEADEEIIRRIK